MNWIRNTIAGCAMGVAVACAAGVPMPAATPEEIIALAHRTYDYVAKSVPAKELAVLKEELAIDEKWYTDAKKANDAREMRNAVRELKSVRRRILFRHPDLQFKRLLAVQRGLPFSQESGTTDQYAGGWSRPGPGLVAIDNWQEAPHKTVLLKDSLPWGTVLNPDLGGDRRVSCINKLLDALQDAGEDVAPRRPADAEKYGHVFLDGRQYIIFHVV